MVGHRFQAVRAVQLQRVLSSDHPRREDQIGVADGVVGMQMREERGLEILGPDRSATSRSRSRRPPNYSRSEIDEICAIANGNRGRWSCTLRVWAWRAGAEQD